MIDELGESLDEAVRNHRTAGTQYGFLDFYGGGRCDRYSDERGFLEYEA